ncbi:hypothetical protein BSZ35_15055 [Salinibacter sp. 10B]|uniref:S49 family peptidase n=1 Tax=Salinibacter sp. 10B TaxID=1923971 RepID=UPI000D29E861|nr:S49 family peptidase [Salinibacter sp. 10B]PQJ35736.1 hypothetical protein BSZ35_15055 [Salinibacter sp. 10B]
MLVLLFGVDGAFGQSSSRPDMASYYETTDFLGAPPSVFREGLLGYGNPALPTLAGNHFVAAWSTDGREAASVDDWGVFTSVGGMGAGVLRRKMGPLRTTGYHLSLSGGTGDAAFGIGYQGFAGDATAIGRYNRIRVGTIARPSPYVSFGLIGNVALETDDREVVGEVGLRPLGTSRLTLFADAAWGDGQAVDDVPWSAGAAVEILPGLDVRGRYFENDAVSLGLRLELGRGGLDSQSRIAPDGDYDGQVYRVRVGAYEPSAIAESVRDGKEHVTLSTDGSVRYQETRFGSLFMEDAPRFYEILRTLEQAGQNERIAALALNLSDLQISPELAWELRSAMEAVQRNGVKVVVHLESGGMTAYHLASVADVVALDPQGLLTLPGYASSRTFVKGTLDKLGLGVQAWRFFEYKSAFERFSRADFSSADSLQRKQYVDDQYELVRDAVAEARSIDTDTLDRIIDQKTILTAQEARQAGLVDTLARWHDREEVLRNVTPDETSALDADVLDQITTATRDWGAKPEVAIVYGIGATQVEGGMGSRKLSKQIRELAEDDDVAAVVFRVDSPGGSPVAAAQVGDAIKMCAEKKPVIVSQGQLAGSGGYWVSTHADTIVAGPNTVTGSIGVIGGWIYDDGFSDKTGLSSDVVQRGERADLFKGIRLPLLGIPIPTRQLTDEELARIETVIRKEYDQFVAAVADGRDTTSAHIREIGEGRIYSGLDGKEVGLVDEIGGLSTAINLARTAAGLTPAESTVREVNPYSGAFSFGRILPGGLETFFTTPKNEQAVQDDPEVTFLRLMLKHQPSPLVLLPPTYSRMAE